MRREGRRTRQYIRIVVAGLRVPDPKRQADIRRRLVFDTGIAAETGRLAGIGIEGGKRASGATRAGIIFQRIETPEDPERRVLEVVTELHALGGEVAERSTLADAAQAVSRAAAAVDKKAVRKLVVEAAVPIASVKTRKVAVGVRNLAAAKAGAESDGQTRRPEAQRRGLGVGRPPSQTKHRQSQCETESA